MQLQKLKEEELEPGDVLLCYSSALEGKTEELALEPNTNDTLSSLLTYRARTLDPKQSETVLVYSRKKIHRLQNLRQPIYKLLKY